MFRQTIVWVVRPVVTVVFGQAVLQTLHLCGVYPDTYLAERAAMLIKQPPASLMIWIQWALAILIGVTVLVSYEFMMRRWFRPAASVTADSPSITVELSHAPMTIDGLEVVCSIKVENRTDEYLHEKCLVRLLEMSCPWPGTMPRDFVLRTESQIRGRRSGRFNLSVRDKKTVPILFQTKPRRDFLMLIDENIDSRVAADKEKSKHQIPMPIIGMEMLIETTGARVPGKYLLTLTKGPNWSLASEIRQVSSDYTLSRTEGNFPQKNTLRSAAFHAPELAGVVNAMMERAMRWDFRLPLQPGDKFIDQYRRLEDSDHPAWTDPANNQLRRDFLNRCGRCGQEYERREEADEARTELKEVGKTLISRLLG